MVCGSRTLFNNLSRSLTALPLLLFSVSSCANPSIKWEGSISKQVANYMTSFQKFRSYACTAKAEPTFDEYLKSYRGQGYWIPKLNDDVDVDSIKALLPEMEKKLSWIREQKRIVTKNKLPGDEVTEEVKSLLKKLLDLKKSEISTDEKAKLGSRQESLKLQDNLTKKYETLIKKVSYLSGFKYPVDHLKNRKVYDQAKEKENIDSDKIANFSFLYRKLVEDGAYNKDHTGSDIYLRTTIDTLHFELKVHGFYLSEDARYDLDFVLTKIESELKKGKDKLIERLTEWEERTERTMSFYKNLTLPENKASNKELIKEHNIATDRLKDYVYKKQAEVYKYWLNQSELTRAIFSIETILMNEVGGVDGDDALERMDVARVVMNRLDKPKYLSIKKKEFIYPYISELVSEKELKEERWLNALFKQGEFSFTYYYMGGVSKIFCPDISPRAKNLRRKNIEIALQVLKEGDTPFKATRYFSRASMIGRIHMDSIWEDYAPYPERPGLLAEGQKALTKAFDSGEYSFLYAFKDPALETYQVLQINGSNYAIGEKNGVKLFFHHRNPHYFRYFTKN